MNTPEQSAEITFSRKEQAIIDVAERLFATRGYEGTSVRDIAQEARVNVAMISYYFGSKEKLLESIVIGRISAGRLVLENLVNDRSLDPVQKIDQLVEGVVDRMLGNAFYHQIMLRSQLNSGEDPIRELYTSTKLKNLELVNRLIQDGQKRKMFVKHVDVPFLMMTIVGTVYQAATGHHFLHAMLGIPEGAGPGALEIVRVRLKAHLKKVIKATLTCNEK